MMSTTSYRRIVCRSVSAAVARRHLAAVGSLPFQQRRISGTAPVIPSSAVLFPVVASAGGGSLSFRMAGFPGASDCSHRRTRLALLSDRAAGGSPEAEKEAMAQVNVHVTTKDEDEEGGGGGPEDGDDEMDRSKFTREEKFRMPDMGEAGEEDGEVVKWYKKEGDIIRRGDILCDVKTELFEFGMQSDDEQVTVMGEILVLAGDEPVEPGEVLCKILHEETDIEKNKE
mmetsp:Transcript_36078/g.107910  ORF Transcript_36078/g.107910 Transcript_36078/m.107910 type:complete len:228 (-) Transcript_36078:2569-3252(-)